MGCTSDHSYEPKLLGFHMLCPLPYLSFSKSSTLCFRDVWMNVSSPSIHFLDERQGVGPFFHVAMTCTPTSTEA